jgi:UDP-glucose 4-epimerase
MAILITGGAGCIGSHMAHELADRGEQPVVIDDFFIGLRMGNTIRSSGFR